MGLYRAQIAIVSDILNVAQENTFENNGASVTHLIRRANISHGRLSKILENLVSQVLSIYRPEVTNWLSNHTAFGFSVISEWLCSTSHPGGN